MTDPAPPPSRTDQPDRLALLEEALASLPAGGGAHGPEARALAVGTILVIASVVLVIAGWYGASGTLDVGEQIPYLISGGVAGLVAAVIGSVLFLRYSMGRYLRYWIIRLVHEDREQTDRVVAALERVEAAVRSPRDERALDRP
ncbi:MAG: hypothetical protein KJ056_11655 [Acidimicrobiia bacterium]|nr:hypothetical protein [Acidimicrobiia bacterium]MCL4293664.1 hypothetical protein [Acidimicrobiia bacterium]